MYSQEIYIFFYDILSLALIWRLGQVLPVWLDVCPTGAFSRFSRVAESPPWSWSSAGSPLSWNIHDTWERFGSQELLIERLWGRSTGTELTPMLPRAFTASPPTHTSLCSSRAARSLFSLKRGPETTTPPLFRRRWASDAACPPARSRAPSSQLTQVQRCWSLQLRSRVSHKAWKRKDTEGDPGG